MPDSSLDELNKHRINRFAAVIVAAKKARKINQEFIQEREASGEQEQELKEPKAANLALKSLIEGEIEFSQPGVKARQKG